MVSSLCAYLYTYTVSQSRLFQYQPVARILILAAEGISAFTVALVFAMRLFKFYIYVAPESTATHASWSDALLMIILCGGLSETTCMRISDEISHGEWVLWLRFVIYTDMHTSLARYAIQLYQRSIDISNMTQRPHTSQ